jgi:hypothetical protein
MHELSGGLILGYHGCDRVVGEKLIAGEPFEHSANNWDWLGPGSYFWEANPKRGYDFAAELKERAYKHGKVAEPFVVGAVLQLGLCLDLSTLAGIEIVKEAYSQIVALYDKAAVTLPENNMDLLRRNLDCAVIGYVHEVREQERLPAIDTVRGVFVEGGPAFPGSGFHEKTHIQLCIRNPRCIKGVFRVPQEQYL